MTSLKNIRQNRPHILFIIICLVLGLSNCDRWVDLVPPKVQILEPEEGTVYFDSFPCRVKASDNYGVKSVEVFVNDELVHTFTKEPYTTVIDYLNWFGKTAMLKAIVYDRAGNFSNAKREIQFSHGFQLISPNGGEQWQEQSVQEIIWKSIGNTGSNVALDYTIDGGESWNLIVESTEDNGFYAWTLPNFIETQSSCRVKVASTSTVFADISDAYFTITKGKITITSPNGGENWREWSTHTITWTSSGDVGGYVSLHYSMDGGTTWTEITTSTLNNGSYSWTLPTISATQTACRVKVSNTTTGDYGSSDGNVTMENWVPILAGSCDTPGYPRGVQVSGGYAYVAFYGHYASDESGLQIINVSNPASPTLAGYYDTGAGARGAYGVFVSGGYAYVADGESGLQVINVSNPANPTLAGSYDTPGYVQGVFVSGGYAYVADGDVGLLTRGSGLLIINVSNPANPILAGIYDNLPGGAVGVFVSGSYAYVVEGYNGLRIINVSNPASPTFAGYYNTPGHAWGVLVSGSYAYVADGDGGLQVINVTDPASPTLAGSYDTPYRAAGIFVSGSYAYVADGVSGLQVINVADPASPTLAGSYDTPGWAFNVFVSGGYAYVADGVSGLQILNVSGLP